MAVLAAVLAGGCGRIAFDAITEAGGEGDGGPGIDGDDRPPDAALPDPVSVSLGEAPGTDVSSVTADTSIIDDTEENNCGRCSNIYAGVGEVGFVRFDLTSIDATEVVEATVELWLQNTPTSSGTVQFYLVLEAWDEGNRSSENPGVANWIERQPGVPWTSPGAGPGSRGETPFLELVPSPVGTPTEVPLPLDVVNQWLDNPEKNHGILVIGRDYGGNGGDGHPHFVSSEGGPEDRRPTLRLSVR